jgi:hypothetical protein
LSWSRAFSLSQPTLENKTKPTAASAITRMQFFIAL